MFGLIKKMFIELIIIVNIVSTSNHTNCVLLSSQELCYYPFAVKLDRWVGSCDTLNDLSNKVCVPRDLEKRRMGIVANSSVLT